MTLILLILEEYFDILLAMKSDSTWMILSFGNIVDFVSISLSLNQSSCSIKNKLKSLMSPNINVTKIISLEKSNVIDIPRLVPPRIRTNLTKIIK